MDTVKKKIVVDVLLFVDFLLMAISGLTLWLVYPAGEKSGQAGVVFLFDRFAWLEIHHWLSVILIVLILVHLLLSWTWIKINVFRIGAVKNE